MAAAANKYKDCYFFFYSTCTKGAACPFRHCEAALGSEVVCDQWQKTGFCPRGVLCSYRHMLIEKYRNNEPCFWESQPNGCRKPHCVFKHTKPRIGIDQEPTADSQPQLILPTTDCTPKVAGQLDVYENSIDKVQFKVTLKNDSRTVLPRSSGNQTKTQLFLQKENRLNDLRDMIRKRKSEEGEGATERKSAKDRLGKRIEGVGTSRRDNEHQERNSTATSEDCSINYDEVLAMEDPVEQLLNSDFIGVRSTPEDRKVQRKPIKLNRTWKRDSTASSDTGSLVSPEPDQKMVDVFGPDLAKKLKQQGID